MTIYEIQECSDYEKLSTFFYNNGLEIEPGIKMPKEVLKCWECIDSTSRHLIGAASLEMREGEYVVADLAVDDAYRECKIGTELMHLVEKEILSREGTQAWLVGKVPGFYIKLGWEVVLREQAPDISKCFSCSKFGYECNPQVMHKSLDRG